jgi:RHS repeat-associated protein
MLDGLDVIHMNGRIYDSALGRFLQADPIVQDPTNGQNFNRYTYVWNNPLAYTDPSGFISVGGWISHLMTVIQIASWFIPGLQPLAAFLNGAGGLMRSFVTAFVIGGLTTGSFRGGLVSAFGSLVGLGTQGLNSFAQAGINLLVAGASSVAMGGRFRDGLAGGLRSMAIGFVGQQMRQAYETRQTGGKLQNGARGAVMQTANNNAEPQTAEEQLSVACTVEEGGVPMPSAEIQAIARSSATAVEAEMTADNYYEYGSFIFERPASAEQPAAYTYSQPDTIGSHFGYQGAYSNEGGFTMIIDIHGHPPAGNYTVTEVDLEWETIGGNPAVGESRTIHPNGLSPEDRAGGSQTNRARMAFPHGGQVIYYHHPNMPERCHYEIQR